KRRKATGGLRIARSGQGENSTETSDRESSIRQLESGGRNFPQRKKNGPKNPQLQPSTLDRFIIGIFEQIHGPINLDPQVVMDQWPQTTIEGSNSETTANSGSALASLGASTFSRVNLLCRKITHASRCCRSLEVIVQAHWVQCFDARVQALTLSNPTASSAKSKKAALMEACEDFGWSEKDMRNKMAVWRGYYEIKEAAGWVALVFAGMGIYRFCKYRVSFDQEAMKRLRSLRHRFEVAADTIHPHWRDLLAFIGEPTERKYTGHQHDWVVSDNGEAIPLARTYLQWDPHFSFEHIDSSVIDQEAWSLSDPRDLTWDMVPLPQVHRCAECGEVQSDDPKENCCRCFPNLYGGPRGPCPVQVFQTANGRNNGLIACCPFERGAAIGEFVGLVTTGLKDMDVMQGETNGTKYQIWQGRMGNYTRFVNHSCYPNSQFEKFVWRGMQRIVLVSRGIEAGGEITVDYSGRYWSNLDKVCLCGEGCCRYR
ncbi:SET domain-containing protein, partial [Saccharata proteae CBS 121410]